MQQSRIKLVIGAFYQNKDKYQELNLLIEIRDFKGANSLFVYF